MRDLGPQLRMEPMPHEMEAWKQPLDHQPSLISEGMLHSDLHSVSFSLLKPVLHNITMNSNSIV